MQTENCGRASEYSPTPPKNQTYPKEDLSLSENQLIPRYAGLIEHHLYHVTKNLPKSKIEPIMCDLRQEARIALLGCWRVYQQTPSSERTGNFITMSYHRIRGSIIDYYRDRRATTVNTINFVSWEAGNFDDHYNQTTVQDYDNPEKVALAAKLVELEDAKAKLKLWEQRFLILYYEKEMTLRKIGEMAGVTESRACQVHTAIISKLFSHLSTVRG